MVKRKLLYIILLSAVFVVMYHDVIRHIVHKWATPEGAHGPLILAVSVYLVWFKRHEIRRLEPRPELVTGALLLAAGCFVFFAGEIGSTIVVQLISMVPVLLGAILLLFGFAFFRAFLLPVGYLVFLTGFIEQLLGSIGIYLQKITAWISALIFRLLGWPVFLDATVIQLPHISLEVVRSCSGISHIVSLLALAVPLAHFTQAKMIRKIVLILSALFIGIFANGLRVALIGIYAFYNEGADLHGPYETLYVSFIFFFGLVVLVLLSRFLNRKSDKFYSGDNNKQDSGPIFQPMRSGGKVFPRTEITSFIVAAIIFGATFGLMHFHTPVPVGLKKPLDQFPLTVAGFSGENMVHISSQLRPFPAHEELMRRYENHRGNSLELYIGYFELQDGSDKIIDYRRAWMHEEVSIIMVQAGEKSFRINKTRLRGQNAPVDVYFWYWLDGRVITSQYTGKFLTFYHGLLKRRTNAAVITLATRNQESEIVDLLAELIEATGNHLSGL